MTLHRCLLAATLVLASGAAAAADGRFEPKALARYDASYVQCEASFPEMKGHRDEAYLSLWRLKPAPKQAARLTELRNTAAYKAERKVVAAERPSTAASQADVAKTLQRQCRGLWGELQNAPKLMK
jgi:hypothetical protein